VLVSVVEMRFKAEVLLLNIVLVVMAFVPLSAAQTRSGRPFSSSRGAAFHHGARRFSRGGFLASPFFYPDYDYSDYETAEPYLVETAPSPLVLTQRQNEDESAREPKPAPLLIEWRGDRYVRFGGMQEKDSQGNSTHPDYAETKLTTPVSARQEERGETAPTVLVFRDGHREEISDYAIADGVIYVQTTYWQNLSRTKPIPLSALDPMATMQANQKRGVKFLLPSASNVVVASF
jgi:hypothetical protein